MPVNLARPMSVGELPPPPQGKTGWPWTEGTHALPSTRRDGSSWPLISIVTPNYNQSDFIEETIRSVLLQGYPNLEYIIVDGGSTDQSVDIAKKYERWISYWISETDRGQVDAINKGLLLSSGAIFQWLNSDDVLLPDALLHVASAFLGEAVAAPILIGNTRNAAERRPNKALSTSTLLTGKAVFSQPGLWLPRAHLLEIGIDERFHYAFDWDMAIRYFEKFPTVVYIDAYVIFFRHHGNSKTIHDSDSFAVEGFSILARLANSLDSPLHRSICRQELRRRNWERRCTQWHETHGRDKLDSLRRMMLLAIRKPSERMSRFWLGAVRRMAFDLARSMRSSGQ